MYSRRCEIRRVVISAPSPSVRPSRMDLRIYVAPSLSLSLSLPRARRDLSEGIVAGEDCARGNATTAVDSGWNAGRRRHRHTVAFVDGRALCLLGRLAALLPDWRDGWLSSDADAIPIPGCQRQSCGRRVHS